MFATPREAVPNQTKKTKKALGRFLFSQFLPRAGVNERSIKEDIWDWMIKHKRLFIRPPPPPPYATLPPPSHPHPPCPPFLCHCYAVCSCLGRRLLCPVGNVTGLCLLTQPSPSLSICFCLSSVFLSLSACLSVCLSLSLSVCVCVCLSVSVSVSLSLSLSLRLSVSVCLSHSIFNFLKDINIFDRM